MFTLTNGTKVLVKTEVIKGMAGEPMEIVRLETDNGMTCKFEEIAPLMTQKDAAELADHLKEVQESNNASAINFTY